MNFGMIFLATLCGVIAAGALKVVLTTILRIIMEYRRFRIEEKKAKKKMPIKGYEVESYGLDLQLQKCERINAQLAEKLCDLENAIEDAEKLENKLESKLDEGLVLLEALDKRGP